MSGSRRFGRGLAAAAALALLAAPVQAQTMRTFETSRHRGTEAALRVQVDFAAGTLKLGAGTPGRLYQMQLDFDADRYTPVARFDGTDPAVSLGVHSAGQTSFQVISERHLAQRAVVELAPDVPLHLNVTLGAGVGAIDLGGLTLADASIRTAASRTTVSVSRPNRGHCTTLDLDAGASELVTNRLGNSRCAEIRFEGGVGKVALDLSGAWTDVLRVRARMALGELRLLLPRDAGVEIVLDRTLTTFRPVGFTRHGATYTSGNFDHATRTIRIDVSTAVGGIVTEWID
ncbi:MAG: hypothetical protein ACHQXA_00975 [Gemmatimonadales bacterium]